MNSKYMHACQDLLFGDNQSLHALDKMVDIVNTMFVYTDLGEGLLVFTAETHG